jgi:diguanylate cyclase (GGDEF)-like protein
MKKQGCLEALAGEVPPLPAKASSPALFIIHYSLFIIHYSLFIIHYSFMESQFPIILVVDDIPANIKVLLGFLTDHNFNVLIAKNGYMALKIADTKLPQLILLDVMMPGIDGFETCRQLKANPKTQDIPVIFMTALSETMNKIKGFEVGAVDYVTKPFQQEELLARINTHLTIRQLQQQLQIQNAELETKHHLTLQLNAQLQHEIEERQKVEIALLKANTELQRLACIDSLTQIANRRRFDEYLQQEWRRTVREQTPLSLIMCDIDHFKCYNDTYGHQAGDDCLRQVAFEINQVLKRATDLVARYGGEEFVIILPNTPAAGALYVAQNIQKAILELKIVHSQSSVSDYVTLSMGVSSTTQSLFSPEALVTVADHALYEAKNQGRNRVVLFRKLELDD